VSVVVFLLEPCDIVVLIVSRYCGTDCDLCCFYCVRALWDLLAMMGHLEMMEYQYVAILRFTSECKRFYCIAFNLRHCTLDSLCRETQDLKGSVAQLDQLEHRYICLSICLSVCLSVCLAVSQSVSQSVNQ